MTHVPCVYERGIMAIRKPMMLPEYLVPILEMLRRAYPDGVPRDDYFPLLVALRDDLSDENLAAVVAELLDDEIVVVDNDSAAAVSIHRPSPRDVTRVREQLLRSGWDPEETLWPVPTPMDPPNALLPRRRLLAGSGAADGGAC